MEKEEINKINLDQKTRLMLRRTFWSGLTMGMIGLSAGGASYVLNKSCPLIQEATYSAIQAYGKSEGEQEEVSTASFEVKKIKKKRNERNEWENTLEERIEPEEIASLPKEKKYVHQEIKSEQLYIVKKGDTLADIARRFTGNLHNYKMIVEYNNISNPNRIEPGQVLMIPSIH